MALACNRPDQSDISFEYKELIFENWQDGADQVNSMAISLFTPLLITFDTA